MPQKQLSSFIWMFIRPHRWTFLVFFLVSLVWSLDTTLWPYILRVVIDILTRYDLTRSAAWPFLKVPLFWGLGFWLFVELSFRIQGFIVAKTLPHTEAELRMTMFDHIQRHSPRYFNEHFAGSLANKITDMTTQVSSILQQLLITFIPAFTACILAVIFLFFISPLFALIMALWVSVHFTICITFTRKCADYEHLHSSIRSSLMGKIVDSLTNHFAINLFYRFAHEQRVLDSYQQEELTTNLAAKRYVEIMRVFLGLSTFLGAGLAMTSCMIYFWLKNWISTGEVAQLFNTTWNITMLIWITGAEIPILFQSIGIAKQALAVMQEPQDILDPPHASVLTVSKGEILFDNVSFQYGKMELFKDKHAHIQGGEKVGLVGYSGSGKSTFISLILRLYPLQQGAIFIDHQNIADVTLQSLRQQIALIPQDPILFHRSIKENIRFGRLDASDEEVWHAAQLAHCDEFISQLPKGYDTFVGERGSTLSGGERQRIAIARAVLAKAPILILDEATSALDSVTETYIQESLEQVMQRRTTLVVAHRLSTLNKMDRILVFDQGKIVEEGSHQYLLHLKGLYTQMWQKQAGGFLPDKPL